MIVLNVFDFGYFYFDFLVGVVSRPIYMSVLKHAGLLITLHLEFVPLTSGACLFSYLPPTDFVTS